MLRNELTSMSDKEFNIEDFISEEKVELPEPKPFQCDVCGTMDSPKWAYMKSHGMIECQAWYQTDDGFTLCQKCGDRLVPPNGTKQ